MKFYILDNTAKSVSQNEFLDYYGSKYFSDYPQNDIELEKYIECKLQAGDVDYKCIMWKMGRNPEQYRRDYEDGKSIPNGYGKQIGGLKDFLCYIDDNRYELQKLLNKQDITREKTAQAYEILLKRVPENFGPVYLITVLYFLSKRRVPIYDQFAHKAIKAIYFEKQPEEIYVGSSPLKMETNNVISMLDEYMWFLEQVFGTSNIPRTIDRALWAYGHKPKRIECNG